MRAYVAVGEVGQRFRAYIAPLEGDVLYLTNRELPHSLAAIPRRMAENPCVDLEGWVTPQLEASAMAALYRERFGN